MFLRSQTYKKNCQEVMTCSGFVNHQSEPQQDLRGVNSCDYSPTTSSAVRPRSQTLVSWHSAAGFLRSEYCLESYIGSLLQLLLVASSCCLMASWASICIFSSFSSVTDLSGRSFGLHRIMVGTSSMESCPGRWYKKKSKSLNNTEFSHLIT